MSIFALFACISLNIPFNSALPVQNWTKELSFNSCGVNGLSFWTSREQSYLLLAPFTEDLVFVPVCQVPRLMLNVFSVAETCVPENESLE